MHLRLSLLMLTLFLSVTSACSEDNDYAAESEHKPNEPITVSADGLAEESCSPVDGPAVRMVFDTSDNRQVIVRLNTSIEQVKGTWELGNGDKAGGLSIALCKQEQWPCEQADDGKLLVERVTSDQIEGELSFALGQIKIETLEYDLRLKTTEKPRCG